MVEIQAVYRGELRCEATHGPSGAVLVTDAPVDNEGRGESFSPTDLVATALGTCMMTILGIVARRHDLDVTGATVQVTKEMAAKPRRIARLAVLLRIPAKPEERLRRLLEQAVLACPVHHSLHPEIELPITVEWGR